MNNWQTIRTRELIDAGILEIGDGYRARNSEMGNTGLPFIRAGDVNGRVSTSGCELLAPPSVARAGHKRSRTGDVVLTTKGTVGRLAFVDERTPEFIYSPQLCFWRSLRPDRLVPRFLFYCLQSDGLRHQMGWSAGQTDMAPYISLTDQRNAFQLKLPERSIQDQIVHILGSLDDKIELNRRMNETLEAMAQAIFRDWFVDFGPTRRKLDGATDPIEIMGGLISDPDRAGQLADLFPVKLGDDGLPEGWLIGKVGDIIEILDSKRIPLSAREREARKGPYPYHGATGIMDYVDDYLFDEPLLLLGEDGSVAQSDGFPYTQYVWEKIWVNNHAHVLRGSGISTEQLKLFFDQTYIIPFVTGAVQPKLNQRNLTAIPFTRAGDKIHKAFDDFIEPIFAVVRARMEETRTLAATRDLLLPKLMSGEIRLRDAEREVAA